MAIWKDKKKHPWFPWSPKVRNYVPKNFTYTGSKYRWSKRQMKIAIRKEINWFLEVMKEEGKYDKVKELMINRSKEHYRAYRKVMAQKRYKYALIKKNKETNPRGRFKEKSWKHIEKESLIKMGRWETPEMKRARKMAADGYKTKEDLPYELVT